MMRFVDGLVSLCLSARLTFEHSLHHNVKDGGVRVQQPLDVIMAAVVVPLRVFGRLEELANECFGARPHHVHVG